MIGTEFLKGQGLGNQLFCYVTARCIAAERGVAFGTAGQEQLAVNIHSKKGMYFMDMDLGENIPDPSVFRAYHEKETRLYLGNSVHDLTHGCYVAGEDVSLHKLPDNTLIYGNMQAEGYFVKYMDEMKEWLRVKPEYDSHEFTKDNLCIINVRGGEYTGSPELYLDRRYWLNGIQNMKKIRSDMEFIIVTDDVEAAKKVLPGIPVYHGDLDRDYVMIKNARYLLLSNSTFACFPAFTSETVQFIIAPKYWARYNVSDGYWASEQNIYSGFHYQDRKGRLFTAEECRRVLSAFFAEMTEWEQYMEQAGFEDAEAVPRLLAIWEKYVSEKPRPGYRPLGLSYSAQGTYKGEQFLDAEQITKNKLYIYTREKNTGFDRRFLMKRVGEGWMIDAVQERLNGWQRTEV